MCVCVCVCVCCDGVVEWNVERYLVISHKSAVRIHTGFLSLSGAFGPVRLVLFFERRKIKQSIC